MYFCKSNQDEYFQGVIVFREGFNQATGEVAQPVLARYVESKFDLTLHVTFRIVKVVFKPPNMVNFVWVLYFFLLLQ